MEKKEELKEELKKQKKSSKIAKRLLLLLVLLAAAAYAGGAVYYQSHFYGNGSVFGVSLRNETVESLKEKIAAQLSSYTLTIETRDGEETIAAADLELAYEDQGELEQLLEDQNPFLWFLMAATSKDDDSFEISVNEAKLSEQINALSCMQTENMTAAQDAYLEFQGDQFVMVPETVGNELDTEAAAAQIAEAVEQGETRISFEELSCYKNPAILQEDEKLVQECSELNELIDVVITYDFSDRTEVVDSDEIASWISFGEDGSYELSEELIYDYVYQLGLKYDTMGQTREFTTYSGSTVTLKGGDYGWCINKDKTAEELKELILAGESVTVEPSYLYKGVTRDTNDIGGTYAEIDITNQMMYIFQNFECKVSTPVVTGRVSRGWDTPSGGVWAVDARISPYTLRGQDYNTDVTYWLPFNGNVGIHDATWRDSFGGTIYKTNGSHGCVNTPISAMKTVYEIMQIGYPVIVYGG